jgi:hypothetical protein
MRDREKQLAVQDAIDRQTGPTGGWLCSPAKLADELAAILSQPEPTWPTLCGRDVSRFAGQPILCNLIAGHNGFCHYEPNAEQVQTELLAESREELTVDSKGYGPHLVSNLVMLVRRLAMKCPDCKTKGQALDYLKRKGFSGSPLREAQPEPQDTELRERCLVMVEEIYGNICDSADDKDAEINSDRMAHKLAAFVQQEIARAQVSQLADWMMANSFATGHGDSFEDLLKELTWQVKELRSQAPSPQVVQPPEGSAT